ncbi:Phosphatidylserine/phosphatidylglycerophosphate/cardiolipin synthase [Halorientalis persicus]|uniref:Phosphatidylserine/phosphatidylglycerophosphate/cardiolipin synthase n=1 Tax=Halorientalis persicus TaxID=1367881 RepID=A0A1H8KMP1_9EURY|nr:phospholipase D-like domain-containing protein [Halorientalis persicus]SEN94145.1 Phosphatidylserine/phosphatidylglycerophosphate/cardiolipin synthase [Halorientalis persicus]
MPRCRALVAAFALLAAGIALTVAPAAGLADGPKPVAGVAPTAPINETGPVELIGVYPNPVPDGDAGEFVILNVTAPTPLADYTLTDGEDRIRLPNRTIEDRVALTTAPNLTRTRTDASILALDQGLALANDGDHVTLARDDEPVDTLRYTDAPEGEVATPGVDGVTWRPVGATDFPVVTAPGESTRAFVLPDGASVPAETLADADERILLAGYTLTSPRVERELIAASRRGVAVRILVDGSPVGGLSRRSARTLDTLAERGVDVTVLPGEPARYAFHHAKYAVVDGRALVTTENWKPAGTGGHASRGWGVVVQADRIVSALAVTFRADANGLEADSWRRYRTGKRFEPADGPPANGTFPRRVDPRRFQPERVELLRAPDNAERRVRRLLRNADETIRIEQVSIGSRRQPFLRATLAAARRGVDVRILLSRAWYVEEENRALVEWLNERATREDLPLSARLADPNGRFEKIHAKGVIVDDDQVLVGSLNWNNNSARDNREVAILVEGEGVTGYFVGVFRADWQGGDWRLPAGVVLAVVLAALTAVLVARRFEFEDHRAT